MIFGSWVYSSDELTLDYFENMRFVDLNDYIPSGTWDLVDVPASIEYYNDTSINKTKVQMVYKIKMRRKSLFYVVNIIIPTLLLSSLSVCVFFLPTDDGEKITLSLGTLFALVVFFLLIAKIIPPTSIVVPLISKYLLFTFILNIMSVLNTCIIINLYYKKVEVLEMMPYWLAAFFLKVLPTVLFMKRKKAYERALVSKEKKTLSLSTTSLNKSPSKHRSLYNENNISRYFDQNLNSPISPIAITKTIEKFKSFNYNDYRDDINYSSLKKCNSHHDLILTHDKKSFLQTSNPSLVLTAAKNEFPNANWMEMNQYGRRARFNKKSLEIEIASSGQRMVNKSSLYLDLDCNTPEIDRRYLFKNSSDENTNYSPKQLKKKAKKNKPQAKYNRDSDNEKFDSTTNRVISFDTMKLSENFLRSCRSIEYISNIMKAKDEINRVDFFNLNFFFHKINFFLKIKEDWKQIAAVLDRFFLIVFFVVTTYGTYASLFEASYIFDDVDQERLIRTNSYKLGKP